MSVSSKTLVRSGIDQDILILAIVSLVAAAFYPQFSLTHDASWYLVATDRFLGGARLYTDLLEINPPLAFYLTVPPVAAARTFGVDPTLAYFLYCIVIGFLSCLWSLFILRRSDLSGHERKGIFLAIIVVQFLLPISGYLSLLNLS